MTCAPRDVSASANAPGPQPTSAMRQPGCGARRSICALAHGGQVGRRIGSRDSLGGLRRVPALIAGQMPWHRAACATSSWRDCSSGMPGGPYAPTCSKTLPRTQKRSSSRRLPGRTTRTAPGTTARAGATRTPGWLLAARSAARAAFAARERPGVGRVVAVDLRHRDDLRDAAEQAERAIAADEPCGGRVVAQRIARRRRRRPASRVRVSRPPGRSFSAMRSEPRRPASVVRSRAGSGGSSTPPTDGSESILASIARATRSRWCAIDAPPCASPALARTSARPRTQMRSLTPVPGSESRIAPGANGLADECRPERSRSARSPRNAPSGPRKAQTTTDTLPGADAAHQVLGLAEHESAREELRHHRRVRGLARERNAERRLRLGRVLVVVRVRVDLEVELPRLAAREHELREHGAHLRQQLGRHGGRAAGATPPTGAAARACTEVAAAAVAINAAAASTPVVRRNTGRRGITAQSTPRRRVQNVPGRRSGAGEHAALGEAAVPGAA